MKSIIVVVLVLFSTCILRAQTAEERQGGIAFIDQLSWAEVKAKAKVENKIIFLDVYATWCGPCKKMDKEVYINKEIGDFFNAHFLPVKVQVDQTNNDTPEIKAWYADAKYISEHYQTRELPSFLFLDAEGNLIHRDMGFKSVPKLLALGKTAIDPDLSFAALNTVYKQGKLSIEKLRSFAMTASKMKQKELAAKVAKDYKINFLDHQKEEVLIRSENIDFIKSFLNLINTKDAYFKLLWNKPALMDSFFNKLGISKKLIDYVVTNEELVPVLWENNKPKDIKPDWEQLRMKIARKYTKPIADRSILAQQMSWYKAREDWPTTVKYNIEKIEKEGLDTAGLGKSMLNNMIFNIILKHSTDPVALKKAAGWMEMLIRTQPDRYSWIDTYAGVLYKAGKTTEAISQQEKAVQLLKSKMEDAKVKNKPGLVKKYSADIADYQSRVDKMKQGLPTWED